ncbi:MAG: hypothetical protein ABWK05_00405 [Pyrobaculum sp.]
MERRRVVEAQLCPGPLAGGSSQAVSPAGSYYLSVAGGPFRLNNA